MAFLNPQLIVDGFKPIEQPNPVNALMQALQIQHMQAQSDAARFQMQTQQNALQRQLGIESIYKGLPAGSTPQQISEALTQAGHGAEGLKYAQGAADMGKDLAQTNKWNTDSAKTKLDAEHQQIVATGGILMAASKAGPAAVMEALTKSPTIPEEQRAALIAQAQANPIGFAKQFAQSALTPQQQQDFELRMQTQVMTDRHQRATEGLTARGQNMADARSRESLGVQREGVNLQREAARTTIMDGGEGVGQMLVDKATGQVRPILGPDGKPVMKAAKPMTEAQSNAALFGKRAAEADKILRELDGQYSTVGVAMANTPGVGPLTNWARSAETQKANQAQTDFMTALLRKESGAAISQGEYTTARNQYFPQPGDRPEVIAQKAANRKTAIEGIALGAGAAGKGITVSPVVGAKGAKFLGFE